MVKCDVCGKAMAPMHPTQDRKDGSLYENLKTKRAYHICTKDEEKFGFVKKKE